MLCTEYCDRVVVVVAILHTAIEVGMRGVVVSASAM